MEKEKKVLKKVKISVILSPENHERMLQVLDNTGMTKTEYINQACSNIAIIGIAETANVAEEFAKLRIALENENLTKEAKEAGVKLAVGGKGMLLWQGAESYKLYTGLEMPTDEYQKFQAENEGK